MILDGIPQFFYNLSRIFWLYNCDLCFFTIIMIIKGLEGSEERMHNDLVFSTTSKLETSGNLCIFLKNRAVYYVKV